MTPAEVEDVQWVLPNGRASEVIDFEEEMVQFFVDAAGLLGVPKSLAAVYGIIFATPEPLSFSEIAAKLNLSSGSVSQALRVLRETGAIRKAEDGGRMAENRELRTEDGGLNTEGGGRSCARERFVPDLELRKIVGRYIEQRLEKHLSAGSSRLDVLRRTVPYSGNRAGLELVRRLKSLADWHTRAREILPLARTALRIAQ